MFDQKILKSARGGDEQSIGEFGLKGSYRSSLMEGWGSDAVTEKAQVAAMATG